MRPTWTVYTLTDPRTGEVRYVGSTSLTLSRRLSCHASRTGGTPKDAWIAELRAAGMVPIIAAAEAHAPPPPLSVRREREGAWIAALSATCDLLNKALTNADKRPRHALYDRLVANGVCTTCRRPRGESRSSSLCQPCADRSRAAHHRATRRAA